MNYHGDMETVRCKAVLNAYGKRWGQVFDAPDDDTTWRRLGMGHWLLVADPAWSETSTAVDDPKPENQPVKPKPKTSKDAGFRSPKGD